jgi:hypothetical protein
MCTRRRGRVCVCGRALIPANACEHLTPPPQAFRSASAFNANIGAWNTARVTTLHLVCAASGPARSKADCARSVFDAERPCAAAPLMCARARVCVCAHVAMRIRVYVDGSPMYSHLCSSAVELSLHPGVSMSNAHTHRHFQCCMYTYIFIYASIVRARACVCVWLCVYGGALHVCKLRRSVKIPARVLYSCVHCHAVQMSISLYVCADRPCSHPPLHTRARVRGHELRARVSRPRVYLTRHP